MKLYFFSLLLCMSCGFASAKPAKPSLESMYSAGQRDFHKADYKSALEHFKAYLGAEKNGKRDPEQLFWVLDQVGYIYLRIQNDPDKALVLFKKYESDSRLNEAQQDAISEWMGAATDWKKEKRRPQFIKKADTLFFMGKKYFDKGIGKKKFLMDDKGNADLAIAESYLRPFIIRHDGHPRTAEALLMMGRIKYNLRTDSEYWNENFYLKEVIRRKPGTKIAQLAWKKLNEDVRIGYTGSGGEKTPPSVKKMLESYKKAAFKKMAKPREAK